MKHIRIAVCAEKELYEDISSGIQAAEQRAGMCTNAEWFYKREDLVHGMRGRKYDIALIALNGALGMEAAIGAREESAAIPIVWISDEEAFALQSYRLQIKMFMVHPVSQQQICDAVLRCMEDLPGGALRIGAKVL